MSGRLLVIVVVFGALLYFGWLGTVMGWVALVGISLGILTARSHTPARGVTRRRRTR